MDNKDTRLKSRKGIPEKYRWKLEDIYKDDDLWEKDYEKAKAMIKNVEGYRTRLKESPQILLDCLKLRDDALRFIDKIYVYAHMRRDEDNSNTFYQGIAGKAEGLNTYADTEFSFIVPEILSIPAETIESFLNENKGLKLYKHYLDEILRIKEHVLSPEQEKIVSSAGDISNSSENIYRMLSSADIRFPAVKDESGNDVELSEGRFYQLIRSQNREVRKSAFEGLYSTYGKYRNTFAATLNGVVKRDIFYSNVKKYPSSIDAALDGDNIPKAVYENIINTVNSNLAPLHRYVDLKGNVLKIDRVHMFDLYAPIVKNVNINIPYEEGLKIVEEGLSPLGSEYIGLLKKGFDSRWIDVFENQGKTNGAYSWGSYDTHPYVLLNYKNSLSDVSTIAHEMGHSIHSYLTRQNQPYVYSNYTLFCAEVASTTNEALLINYLLKVTKDRAKKAYIMNQYLETIRTTVYRQTMFAEFELLIHEESERGRTLTPDYLCSVWHDLNSKYYGKNAVIDEGIDMEWARIPHFYWDFYVYKYVTGYAAATSLSRRIIDEGEDALKRYTQFLKSGDSDYSINLLKKAGVDMTKPEPLISTINVFDDILNQLEGLLN